MPPMEMMMDLHEIAQEANLALAAPSLTAGIVAAYVRNNPIPAADLPKLIQATHAAIVGLAAGGAKMPSKALPVEPATEAEIRRSITPDALISFIDGKPYKTLKRHLYVHGTDPAEYRRFYSLPADYPMVAASYSERRSDLAKAIGLGRRAANRMAA